MHNSSYAISQKHLRTNNNESLYVRLLSLKSNDN
jgi:hypothetical protein